MLNQYYNNHNQLRDNGNWNEWSLLNGLHAESIQIRGMELFYLPREFQNLDRFHGEDMSSHFGKYIPIEMIPEDPQGFSGENLIAKFGIDILNDMKWFSNKKRVLDELAKHDIDYPKVGDLLYFPMANMLYEIKWIEDQKVANAWYPLGHPISFVFTVVMFDHEHETFDTGIEDIDCLNKCEDVYPDTSDNQVIQDIADEISDFSEAYPFGKQ